MLSTSVSQWVLLVIATAATAGTVTTDAPPAPVSKLPPVPQDLDPVSGQLLNSDDFVAESSPESLPDCDPLPDLSPARFRQLTDRFVVALTMPPLRTASVADVRSRVASERPSRPAELTAIEHLLRAAEHLAAAGEHEAAERVRRQADLVHRQAQDRLRALRVQQQQITRAIEQLEQFVGANGQASGSATQVHRETVSQSGKPGTAN